MYDAVADISLLEISGTSIGGILTANTFYSADEGLTGIDAANVDVRFRAVVGDIDAKGSAVPVLRFGQWSTFEQDGGALIVAGGDLIQTNGAAIRVSLSETKTGFSSIRSQDGVKSDGTKFFAKLIQTPLVNTAGQLLNVPGANQLGQGGEVSITQIAPIMIQLITGASYNIPLAIVTGGNPPYTIFLDSGVGFQPMGMNLHIEDDGTVFLIGTPSEGSESPFSRQFGLCVKDLGGNSDCLTPPFSYFVESSSLTGTWTGTWTRPVSGFCEETSSVTWNLNQSGTTVSGTFFKVVTAIEGFCPDQVGTQTSGMLINGNFEGANITIMTDGGTLFEGNFTDNTIEGTGGGSLGKEPFKLQRQP